MKLGRILVAVLLVLSLTLCLAACGDKEKNSGIAGKYTFYSMSYEGETVTAKDLAEMGEETDMYIRLNSDGTGVMVSGDDSEDMAYANGKIWSVDEPDEKVSFSVKGNTLTMEQDGMVMTFKK